MVDVEIDIEATDDASPTINIITNNVTNLHQAVQRQQQQNSRWQDSFRRVADRAAAAARAVAKVAAAVAAVASAAGPAASGLLAAGKALVVFGQAAARLTPLLAFIPAFIAGFALIKTTLKLAGPGLARAFEPITRQFKDAKGNATALVKELQRIVGIDVRPAAEGFAKVNMPAIATAMKRIAYQVNLVTAGFLNWSNSTPGIAAIKSITEATAGFVERLAPHVLKTAMAFGELAGRAAAPAFKALGDILTRILDRLREWANDTSIEDINNALKDLSGYGLKLRQVFGAVRDVGRWLAENEGAVKRFSDVAAGAAIALGIATGNVPAVVLGAVSLIINHWNQLKKPFSDAITWVQDLAAAWQRDAGRIAIAESIKRALDAGRKAFADATKDIGPKWRRFVFEIKQAWEEWAPLIKLWWDNGGRQAFEAAGTALGIFVSNLVVAGAAGAAFARVIAEAFKWMVNFVLGAIQTVINGAAKAFSWVPGLGVQLKVAAEQFNTFRDNVNRALNGIETLKTIRINANVYVTGGGTAAGGVDQRTGNSRNAGLSGLTSWQRVAAALGGERTGGTSRTGGPTQVQVHSEHSISVNLDGQPFRRMTARAINESERRAEWRARNGRR